MKSLGVVRRIDQLGRLVIPKEIRRRIGADDFAPMEMFTQNTNEVVIRLYQPDCIFCGEEATAEFHGKNICNKCVAEIGGIEVK